MRVQIKEENHVYSYAILAKLKPSNKFIGSPFLKVREGEEDSLISHANCLLANETVMHSIILAPCFSPVE